MGAGAVTLLVASHAVAQPAPAQRGLSYSCVDATNKKITSDRPIPQCADREQRVLNSDGSLNHIESRTLTAEEKADAEARQRKADEDRVALNEAIRRDRNLLLRYPNEAAHKAARDKALDDIRNAIQLSETRINALLVERKPLADEAEFYVGKSMPSKLKNQLDANDASLGALRSLAQNHQSTVVRINATYDAELARLRKLWAGAPPGSVGSTASASAPAAKPASVSASASVSAQRKPLWIASDGASGASTRGKSRSASADPGQASAEPR